MRLRNGEHGYGLVTKLLHWLTVGAIVAQFVVGYRIEEGELPRSADRECDPPAEDRSGGDTGDAEEERLDRLEDACEADQDRLEERAEEPVDAAWGDLGGGDLLDGGLSLGEWHLLLGLTILGLGLARVLWRATTPLPPWAPALSTAERRLEGLLEKGLLALLFVIPVTGLLLVAGEDGWLAAHVTAHLAFFVVVSLHVGLVLLHTVLRRDRHLQRML